MNKQKQIKNQTGKIRKSRNKRIKFGYKRAVGRNNKGRLTSAHRGGGVKRLYRKVDFVRRKPGKYEILELERDPNRTADIALIKDESGRQSYVLANESMKTGQTIEVGDKVAVKSGNRMKLLNIPSGSEIYNIELKAGEGGKIARSAGNNATLKAIEGKQALIAMPSGEIRLTSAHCYATLGTLSNPKHSLNKLKKAGQSRYLGRRPKVRGVAKHPGAHPHGGGEGKSPIGLKYPKSPTGKHSKGKLTRKKKKYSDKLIVSKRKKKKSKKRK
jgi:large subunit ribosomal protein L2